MKVYVFTQISKGEVPLSLDLVQVFPTRKAAQRVLKSEYESRMEWCGDCADWVTSELKDNYYEIYFDDDEETTYIGEITELDL